APSDAHPGKALFEKALPGTNGRACATCHVLDEATTLRPESVAARLEENPNDPLFNRLDADDPNAETLSFAHLKKGLVRVVLTLPENMDVIDFDGNVSTGPDRTIFVWRGVPSVANTASTGPYQLDGRQATLEDQAQAAIQSHSEGPQVSRRQLERIADFQRDTFSSPRAWFVSRLLDLGLPLEEVPIPEEFMPLSAAEKRGRDVYDSACQACHGSATTDRIVDREVHDLAFTELGPDGNVRFEIVDGQPQPVLLPRPDDEFINIGLGIASYLGQLGVAPAFNDDLELPRYRFRFYTDGTRSQKVVDLPPTPVSASGDPLDVNPALDERGAPIVGPNRIPQLFSTDPGRAAISGDPADFEAFDVNPLRGIARTAPYFHDNSHETLRDVVDTYSRFILSGIPPLRLPRANPPEGPGLPGEALSLQQKHDLLAFLNRL
ncbi:MAG TPA: cytochrome c peroxidase, partial [Polyangiaceae bacterium]|nr:cytochrome c peroxidase [Polyangiaceae bacterium]